MFRYNRQNNLFQNSHNIFNTGNKKSYTFAALAHKTLQSVVSDNTTFRQHNLLKINHINQLDRIRHQDQLLKINQIGNLDKLRLKRNTKNTDTNINNMLPKPRAYESIKTDKLTIVISLEKDIANLLNNINNDLINLFKAHDPLSKKLTITVSEPSGILNILLQVSNNTENSLLMPIQNNNINLTLTNLKTLQLQGLKYVIPMLLLISKSLFIVDTLQTQYYTNTQYNYFKLIQFVYNMYEQYGNNQMALMIICKGFSQFNKKQMIKLPEDKIGDIIQYILTQIKKDK